MIRYRKIFSDYRAVAAIEFAIAAPVLFLFLFIIINLGLFAWTYDALHEGVVAAARYASVTTSNALLTAKGVVAGGVCTSTNLVQSQFQSVVTPPVGAGAVPQIHLSWGGSLAPCNASNNSAPTSALPGGWVQASVSYSWAPVAMPSWLSGVTINVSDVEPVLNAPGS